nr:hypothetical protein [Bacillus sp. MRMR6]
MAGPFRILFLLSIFEYYLSQIDAYKIQHHPLLVEQGVGEAGNYFELKGL